MKSTVCRIQSVGMKQTQLFYPDVANMLLSHTNSLEAITTVNINHHKPVVPFTLSW